MSKTRLLAISNTTGFGGAEIQLALLAEGLNKQGIYVHVLTNEKKLQGLLAEKKVENTLIAFPTYEMSNKKNFILSFLKWPFYFGRFKKLLKKFKEEKGINTIYISSFNEKIFLTRLAKKMGFKVIWMEHGNLYTWEISRNPLPLYFLRKASYFVDLFISPSPSAQKGLIKNIPFARFKSVVVLNGLPIPSKKTIEEYKQQGAKIREKLGLKNEFILSCISRLAPDKGQEYLIKAISRLKKKKIIVYCFIIGEGEEESYLKNLAQQLGLQNQIIFLGYLGEERFTYLAASDVFCFPTAWAMEGLPLVLIEALIFQKPVIASDIGGVKDVIRPNQDGLLIKPRDEEELALAIEKLYRNNNLLNSLGQEGYDYVKENFSPESMVNKTKKAIEQLEIK